MDDGRRRPKKSYCGAGRCRSSLGMAPPTQPRPAPKRGRAKSLARPKRPLPDRRESLNLRIDGVGRFEVEEAGGRVEALPCRRHASRRASRNATFANESEPFSAPALVLTDRKHCLPDPATMFELSRHRSAMMTQFRDEADPLFADAQSSTDRWRRWPCDLGEQRGHLRILGPAVGKAVSQKMVPCNPFSFSSSKIGLICNAFQLVVIDDQTAEMFKPQVWRMYQWQLIKIIRLIPNVFGLVVGDPSGRSRGDSSRSRTLEYSRGCVVRPGEHRVDTLAKRPSSLVVVAVG